MISPQFGFLDLGAPELIIVLAILLLLFGGKKLPELSRSLGQAMKELREGLTGSDNKQERHEETKPKPVNKQKQL
jgi:sec-independent protein translocase protein TatA